MQDTIAKCNLPNILQCFFAKCKDLRFMKEKQENVEEILISELEDLITIIKSVTSLKEEQISLRSGYNEGYISQTRSRGKVPKKLVQNLIREFRQELETVKDAPLYVLLRNAKEKENPQTPEAPEGIKSNDYKEKYLSALEDLRDKDKTLSEIRARLTEIESSLVKLAENQEVIRGQLKTSLQQDAIRDAGGDLKKADALMKKTNKRLAGNLGIEQTGNQISDSLSRT